MGRVGRGLAVVGDRSAIEWTEATWNPVVGCASVSPGCDNCYAARDTAGRLKRVPVYSGLAEKPEGEPARFTGEVRCLPDRLDQPLRWQRPRHIFVNSMSDLFHPDVPEEYIGRVFEVMALADKHTFQILTKRPQRMSEQVERFYDAWCWPESGCPVADALGNVWLGASIERDPYCFRADHVRRTQAAVRFLSLEPLLGPLPSLDLTDIDWVIVGGESGPGARPMDPEWIRDIRDRCVEAGVAFFFKQWGQWVPYETESPPFHRSQHGNLIDEHHLPADLVENEPTGRWWWPDLDSDAIYRNVGKKAAGRLLDGRTWSEMPRSLASTHDKEAEDLGGAAALRVHRRAR